MRYLWPACLVLLVSATVSAQQPLEIFQDLDEATLRIPRLKDKPYEELVSKDSAYQPETIIFRDVETGAEIWSLTREEAVDIAHNDLGRTPWNCDGSIVGSIGNRAWRGTDGKITKIAWSGFNYVMNADSSGQRKLFVTGPDGSLGTLQGSYNIWDRKDPRALYFAAVKAGGAFRPWKHEDPIACEMWLVRARIGKIGDATLLPYGPKGAAHNRVASPIFKNFIEPVVKFPNGRRKDISGISDNNRLIIQDVNGKSMDDMPNYCVVDLEKKPGDAGFLRAHTLGYGGIQGVAKHDPNNEYRVHSIGISRDGKTVRWGYGSATSTGEPVSFMVPSDSLDGPPTVWSEETDEWGQYQSHGSVGADGTKVYFAGPVKKLGPEGPKNNWGLWVRPEGKPPIFAGSKRPSASGGHSSWIGNDPEWWFAHVYKRDDWEISDVIVAGNRAGTMLKKLCRPYDRRRGAKYESPYHGLPRPLQSPDATKCWFHSSMLMPNNDLSGSYVAVFRRPHAPVTLAAKGKAGAVDLSWTPHAVSREVKCWHVYRGDASGKNFVEVGEAPVATKTFTDATAEAGKTYSYAVTAEEWSGLESDATSPVLKVTVTAASAQSSASVAKGLSGWDKTAPAAVEGFTATKIADGRFRLAWKASADKDLRYYNVYAASAGKPAVEQKRLLVSPPKSETGYVDWTAPLGGAVSYAIVAVDRQGNVSAPAFAQ
jgi:hypothetical protein